MKAVTDIHSILSFFIKIYLSLLIAGQLFLGLPDAQTRNNHIETILIAVLFGQ